MNLTSDFWNSIRLIQRGGRNFEKLSDHAENLYIKVYWVVDYKSVLRFSRFNVADLRWRPKIGKNHRIFLWICIQKFFTLLIANLTLDSRNSDWRIHCSCWKVEKLFDLDEKRFVRDFELVDYWFIVKCGCSSETVTQWIDLISRILTYFDVLNTNITMKMGENDIFKVKRIKNSVRAPKKNVGGLSH